MFRPSSEISNQQKLVITLIIIGLSFLYPLHIVQAVSGWLIVLKEYVLDTLVRIITRALLSALSNTIVGKILNAGRSGGPALVTDWRQFLQNAQYRGEDILRAQVIGITSGAGAQACQYLRSPLSLVFNVQGKSLTQGFNLNDYRLDSLQSFQLRTACTLPSNLSIPNFRGDFTQGGWSAWKKLVQPQNNFYSTYANSLRELGGQRKFEEKIDQSESESGSGYTSKRKDGSQTGCVGEGPNKQCLILGKIVTPADLFSKSGAATIDRELDWLVGSDELQEVIVAVAGALVNRLTNFVAESIIPSTGNVGDKPPQTPTDPAGMAQQDCVNACIAANCNEPPLPACEDIDGDGVSDNRPCDPDDPDPNAACISNCQAQGCQ